MDKRQSFFIIMLALEASMFFVVPSTVSYSQQNKDIDEGTKLISKFKAGLKEPHNYFELRDKRYSIVLDYKLYGRFDNTGTANYRYTIIFNALLKNYNGPGIYPNNDVLFESSDYRDFLKYDSPHISFLDYIKSKDYKNAFYKISRDDSLDIGVRTILTAYIFEKSGNILPAIKTYYTALIHFPKSVVNFEPFGIKKLYAGQVAIASIKRLTRDYPWLKLTLNRSSFVVENGDDADMSNDIIKVDPGELIKASVYDKKSSIDFKKLIPKKEIVRGNTRVLNLQNGDWYLDVNGKPFFIRGIYYNPINQYMNILDDIDKMNLWMTIDNNDNKIIDAPFESWVDVNNNGKKDKGESSDGDFNLLKDIGINTIIIYARDPDSIDKKLLRELYDNYGIYVIIADYLGAYTIGSEAVWQEGTDYTDPKQLKNMISSVEDKVMSFKNEPYVLMWLLGCGNNQPTNEDGTNIVRTNAADYPKEYARFVNEVSRRIHQIDPNHPVAISNFDINNLSYLSKYAPGVDIVGVNTNRGYYGFMGLWGEVKRSFDRPVLITRFGPDVYHENEGFVENYQVEFYINNFRDIVFSQADGGYDGNSIGGVISEFVDFNPDDFLNAKENKNLKNNERMFLKEISHSLSFNGKYGLVTSGENKNNLMRTLKEDYVYFKNNK